MMKSGNNHHNIKAAIALYFVMFLTLVVSAQPPSITSATGSALDCFGDADGVITILAIGGTAPLTYSINGEDFFENGGVFTDLPFGDYIVTVKDAAEQTDFDNVSITQPPELLVSLNNTRDFTCDNITPCNGRLEYAISGGTEPYEPDVVTLDGNPYTGPLNELCAGVYIVSVIDANGCNASSAPFTVRLDIQNPSLTVPIDFPQPSAQYNTSNVVDKIVSNGVTGFQQIYTGVVAFEEDATFDLSNYSNARVRITASQVTTTPVWNFGDFIRLRVSYDGGLIFNDLWIDRCVWNDNLTPDDLGEGIDQAGNDQPFTAEIPIPSGADFNNNVQLKLTVNIGTAGLQYDITSVRIIANERLHEISTGSPDFAGTPNCVDLGSGCTVDYNDSEPIWGCKTVGAEEFLIQRTWTATDSCGKTTSQIQPLRVGAPPFFTNFPEDATFDFCNLSPTIIAPTPNDVCAISNPAAYSIVDLSDASLLETGNGTINPNPASPDVIFEAGKNYQITWSITDDVGFITTATQDITIQSPISISINTDDTYNFCSGEQGTFTITLSGGTGAYDTDNISIDPAIDGSWIWTGNQGTFSTLGLVLGGTEDITISVNDVDNDPIIGGCPSGDVIFEHETHFTIHQLITTPDISRD